MPEGGRALAYSSDMRRAHLSRDERAGLDHKIQTQFRAEMAQLGCTGEDGSGLELKQAVCSTQKFTALKPVSKWGSAASPLSLRERR